MLSRPTAFPLLFLYDAFLTSSSLPIWTFSVYFYITLVSPDNTFSSGFLITLTFSIRFHACLKPGLPVQVLFFILCVRPIQWSNSFLFGPSHFYLHLVQYSYVLLSLLSPVLPLSHFFSFYICFLAFTFFFSCKILFNFFLPLSLLDLTIHLQNHLDLIWGYRVAESTQILKVSI